ncbi:alpha/beta hydrolase [Tistrella sp. BH-R2-4]|uniref:Alpha/beta hydrolase n=1 Tax=Tistrella arctica TaxID=3133430 RepID=A0ABU9YQK0_9PROT
MPGSSDAAFQDHHPHPRGDRLSAAATAAGAPARQILTLDDGAEFLLARIGPRGVRPVILGHGVGFAAHAYRGLWQRLARHREVVLLDMRGHGINAHLAGSGPTQPRLAEDWTAVARHVAEDAGMLPDALFHSYSGVLSLHAEYAHGRLYGRRVFMEPPLVPAASMPGAAEATSGRDFLAERTRRRKDRFASPEAFAQIFRDRPEFAQMEPQAPDDLAAALLVPADDGDGFQLACKPAIESGFYSGNTCEDLWSLIDRAGREPGLVAPSLMMAGRRPDGTGDFTAEIAPEIAVRAGFDFVRLAGLTHMLPLERPALIAGIATAFFDEPHDPGN